MQRWVLLLVAGWAIAIPTKAWAEPANHLSASILEFAREPNSAPTLSASEQVQNLLQTAQQQMREQRLAAAQQTLSQATQVARQLTDRSSRDQLLAKIAVHYVKMAQPEAAIALTQTMTYELPPDTCCVPPRIETEIAIAQAYVQTGQVEQAIQFAERLEFAAAKHQVLMPIITELANQQQFDRAIALTHTIVEDPYQKTLSQYAILKGYVAAGQLSQGWEFTRNFAETGERSAAQLTLVQAAVRSEHYTLAYGIADQIEEIQLNQQALTELALAHAAVGESTKANEVLTQAYELARSETGVVAIAQWAGYFAQIGNDQQALRLVEQAASDYDRADARIWIARAYLEAEQYSKAFEIAQLVKDNELRVLADYPDPKREVLDAIVNRAAEVGQVDLALQVAQSYGEAEAKVKALLLVAEHYDNQPEKAAEVLMQAFAVGKEISEIWVFPDRHSSLRLSNAGLLVDIARALIEIQETEQAIAVLTTATQSVQAFEVNPDEMLAFVSQQQQITNLRSIAQLYAKLNQPDRALATLEMALSMNTELEAVSDRIQNLHGIAQAYLEMNQGDRAETILAQMVSLNEAMTDVTQKQATWLSIARLTAELGQEPAARAWVDRLLQIEPTDQTPKDWRISRLAVNLAPSSLPLALPLLDQISDPGIKAGALVEIATQLATTEQPTPEVTNSLIQAIDQADETAQEVIRANLISSLTSPIGPLERSRWEYDLAQRLNQSVRQPRQQAYHAALIARGYANLGDRERAHQILSAGLATATDITHAYEHQDLLQQILDDYQRTDELALSIPVAQSFRHPRYRVTALRRLAQQFQRMGATDEAAQLLTEAQTAADEIANRIDRAVIKQAIAQQQN